MASLSKFLNTVWIHALLAANYSLSPWPWNGIEWLALLAWQLSKTSSFVNKKEILAAGNENKPGREGEPAV